MNAPPVNLGLLLRNVAALSSSTDSPGAAAGGASFAQQFAAYWQGEWGDSTTSVPGNEVPPPVAAARQDATAGLNNFPLPIPLPEGTTPPQAGGQTGGTSGPPDNFAPENVLSAALRQCGASGPPQIAPPHSPPAARPARPQGRLSRAAGTTSSQGSGSEPSFKKLSAQGSNRQSAPARHVEPNATVAAMPIPLPGALDSLTSGKACASQPSALDRPLETSGSEAASPPACPPAAASGQASAQPASTPVASEAGNDQSSVATSLHTSAPSWESAIETSLPATVMSTAPKAIVDTPPTPESPQPISKNPQWAAATGSHDDDPPAVTVNHPAQASASGRIAPPAQPTAAAPDNEAPQQPLASSGENPSADIPLDYSQPPAASSKAAKSDSAAANPARPPSPLNAGKAAPQGSDATPANADFNSYAGGDSQNEQSNSSGEEAPTTAKAAPTASTTPRPSASKADAKSPDTPDPVIEFATASRRNSEPASGPTVSSSDSTAPNPQPVQGWDGAREHLGQVLASTHAAGEISQSAMQVNMKSDAWGPVSVRATLSNGQLGAEIQVNNHEAHAALVQGLPALEKALNEKGMRVATLGVSQGASYGNAPKQGQEEPSSSPPASPAKLYTQHTASGTNSLIASTPALGASEPVTNRVSVRV